MNLLTTLVTSPRLYHVNGIPKRSDPRWVVVVVMVVCVRVHFNSYYKYNRWSSAHPSLPKSIAIHAWFYRSSPVHFVQKHTDLSPQCANKTTREYHTFSARGPAIIFDFARVNERFYSRDNSPGGGEEVNPPLKILYSELWDFRLSREGEGGESEKEANWKRPNWRKTRLTCNNDLMIQD